MRNARQHSSVAAQHGQGLVLGQGAWLFTVIIISFIRVVKATTRLDYTPQHRHSTDDCIALCCGQVRKGCGALLLSSDSSMHCDSHIRIVCALRTKGSMKQGKLKWNLICSPSALDVSRWGCSVIIKGCDIKNEMKGSHIKQPTTVIKSNTQVKSRKLCRTWYFGTFQYGTLQYRTLVLQTFHAVPSVSFKILQYLTWNFLEYV